MKVIVDGRQVTEDFAAALVTTAEAAPHMVPKLRAVDRLIAMGHAEALMAALNANPMALLRFNAAVEIASNDADARALLSAIGADPDAVLAR